jgi:hypothetical protein
VESSLSCREDASSIEVVDPVLDLSILRLRPTTTTEQSRERVAGPSLAAVAALAQTLAPVASMVSKAATSSQALQVAFAPAVQEAIAAGSLSLMTGGSGAFPVAVDALGRIRGIARVVPTQVLVGAPILPIVLPAAAAAAASYYQHQALQATIEEIQRVVERIEERLRNDDWGVLEAADQLTQSLIEGDGTFDIPDQLRLELAIARQGVERVFRSRRRFIKPLADELRAETRGRPDPWTDRVKKLVKDSNNWVEVSLYVEAMVVRSRLAACTSLALAADGDAQASATLARSITSDLKASYEPLAVAVAPLASRRPDTGMLDRIPFWRVSGDQLFGFVLGLVEYLEGGVGQTLTSLEKPATVTLAAHDVKAIQAALSA